MESAKKVIPNESPFSLELDVNILTNDENSGDENNKIMGFLFVDNNLFRKEFLIFTYTFI
ncbi:MULTISPECIES: hypothetical protein [unclassified Chryseobacterium]|uniref:hypothetical protein n=1 Tax=unclassified Chryseobacterium TaxID=2593645 RepID=UPI000D8AFA2B|nr:MULTISPECIES: hypothetical protein [unclassified Chryseobacterium]PWW20608.1 hypothetical protein DEU40_11330 [Chryseobacterium sp. AG844]